LSFAVIFFLRRSAFSSDWQEGLTRRSQLVDTSNTHLNAVLPWDRTGVDATPEIRVALSLAGTPIGPNDAAIAGHAIAAGYILVTNNVRVFERVPGLMLEDWDK